MENDELKSFCLVLGLLGVVVVGAYGLGKQVERRDYTGAFIQQIEAAYMDGYNDALNGLQRNP